MSEMDISPKNVLGKCDLKCAYNFKYTETKLTAKNYGTSIQLTSDITSTPPVLYNADKYNAVNFYIYCPSTHTYNGTKVAAEIHIVHTPIVAAPQLNVFIPIMLSSESSTASNLLTDIINSVATNAPKEGDSTTLNINNFTLQSIVPVKPFFTYTSLNNNFNNIVFGKLFAIPLNSNTLKTLSEIIKPSSLPAVGKGLFFNSSGPNRVTMGDGIYISCKPTGSSDEETSVEYTTDETTYDYSNILDSPVTKTIFQVIIGCVIFIIIFYVIAYLFNLATTGEGKLPKMKMPSFMKSKNNNVNNNVSA
jgi:hypothetical protein